MPKESKKNSSKNRETEKRRIAREQILSNQTELHYMSESNFGELIDTVRIYPISAYSTKFMSTEDQFTLAVDKIAFPELKSAFLPQETHPERYEASDADFCDYASHFSLNDGDKGALAALLDAFRNGSKRCFVLDDGTYFIAYMAEGSGKRVQFDFDMYNGEKFTGVKGIPSISASFVLSTSEKPGQYTAKPVWNYILTIHQAEAKLPKDAVLKSEYELFQGGMRALIVSLGILPSKLDLSETEEHEPDNAKGFMEIGTAISSENVS